VDADNENMRKNYTSDFKAKAVIEILREAKSINEISSEKGVHVNQLTRWKKTAIESLPQIFEENKKRKNAEKEQEEKIQELYAQIGELTTKVNWLKKKSGLDV
jgi:transposase-like protein